MSTDGEIVVREDLLRELESRLEERMVIDMKIKHLFSILLSKRKSGRVVAPLESPTGRKSKCLELTKGRS